MDFRSYTERTCAMFKSHENLKDELFDWSLGLAEEVGEVFSVLKHHYYGGEELAKEELAKELGDVLWYLAAMAKTAGLDLDAVARLNVAKLEHRFGKDGFSLDGSQQRHGKESEFTQTDVYKELLKQLQLPEEERIW